MMKISLIALFLFFYSTGFSQQNYPTDAQNEAFQRAMDSTEQAPVAKNFQNLHLRTFKVS